MTNGRSHFLHLDVWPFSPPEPYYLRKYENLHNGAFISYVIDTDVKRFNYENKFTFEGSCLLSNDSKQASTDRIFCKLRFMKWTARAQILFLCPHEQVNGPQNFSYAPGFIQINSIIQAKNTRWN